VVKDPCTGGRGRSTAPRARVSAAPAEGHRPTLLDTYLATLTFEAFGDETILIMRAEFDSAAGLAFARSGGFYVGTNQALDKLERLLASH